MDLTRVMQMNTEVLNTPINLVGLGATGSHVAEQLVRLGFKNFNIYDYDTVGTHNLSNQMYQYKDLGKSKTQATKENLLAIEPSLNIRILNEGWDEYKSPPLNGYVFLCVDDIEVRKKIVKLYLKSTTVKCILDFRISFKTAQHYASEPGSYEEFYESMDFTKEEAKENQPVSPCNTKLTALPTIKIITSYGIANFINMVNKQRYSKLIIINSFEPSIISFLK